VNYDKKFVDATSTADGGVQARFADGTTAEGDLLVGCDGIHSHVRQILDSKAPAPRYVPVLNTGGYIPNFVVDVPAKEFRMQFGTRCFFAWCLTPDGGTVWFANPPMSREPECGVLSGMQDSEWRRWLHELMQGDVGPSHEIIDAAPGPVIGWATYDMPVVRRWHNNQNMLVIGHRSSNSKTAGPIMRVIRDLMLPIVFGRAARDGGKSMMWLQGHHIDFSEPIKPVIRQATGNS
jgi:2-polyprenyl-6-methoxyphenol hydroxylase-like FAD-dependent oxidoreductase